MEYIPDILHKFQHTFAPILQYASHSCTKPKCNTKVQYARKPDTSPIFPLKWIACIQQIVGTILYYAVSVDSTLLVALGYITSEQSK